MTLTVQAALAAATQMLTGAGSESAARDARHLMAAALETGTDRITLHLRDPLAPMAEAAFFASVRRRANGVPVAQIVGGRMFHGHWFTVTVDTLDPRPETETLVAAALETGWENVLDLGTGTGCILLSLLAARPGTKGTGADLSGPALAVAARNAKRLDLTDRVTWQRSDWFAAVAGRFDLIVSNPPYIAASEMHDLQRDVREHEPRIALTDEADGLSAYRVLTAEASGFLVPGGRLIVEIGPTQGRAVVDLFWRAGFADIAVRDDLDGRDRVVTGKMPPKTPR